MEYNSPFYTRVAYLYLYVLFNFTRIVITHDYRPNEAPPFPLTSINFLKLQNMHEYHPK